MALASILYGFIAVNLAVFIWAMTYNPPKASPPNEPQASQPSMNKPEELAWKVFGKANKTENGAVEIAFYAALSSSPSRLNITYHYNPIRNQVKAEIGIHFSKKIKEMYERVPELDHIVFNIQAPATDKYGNTAWTKAVSFKMTRATYNKINWSNFAEDRLLDVAEDVWITPQLK
jgi:hypothetical protein